MRPLHVCILAALLAPLLVVAAARRPSNPPWPHGESSSSREQRIYQTAWHDALTEHRKGRTERAIRILEKLEGGDSLASLYRSVLLAGFHIAAGEPARAEARLAETLHEGGALLREPVWLRHVYRLRLRNALKLPQATRGEVLRAALAAPLEKVERTEVLYQLLDLDTSVVPRATRAVYLRQLLPLALPGPRLDAVYRRWLAEESPDDTTWEARKLVLDLEETLGLWSEAIARARSLHGRVPSPELARILQGKIALWYYNKGSYGEAIKEYVTYGERHGDTPDNLLQIARAHRALSHDVPARAAYSRLVARFPRDARAAETLWMYAFDDEMLDRTDTALAAYARIARDFPQNPRSGEAMFRAGLVQYRAGNFAAASRSFAELRLARKSGRLTGAARYWEGKSLAGEGKVRADSSGARLVWASLVREYPFGHYGHLARAELTRGGLPDSLAWSRVLNRATGDSLKSWLTTALSGAVAADGFGESSWLPVTRLFSLGLDTLAVLTLQARANAAPANLWLVYDAAVRCRQAGFGYEAYRFALRLSDRLPLEQWPAAPVEVLRLFYPPSYAELVRPEAARAGIPPALVLALIKQESGFDPAAVSRVGARGLMQLMPTTGTEQARKEGMRNFHPDSLFDPAVNVRLGVAYLRDVLRRHDGNINHALAHYNAGPTALARWMPRLEGRPPEEAVEDIGYAETREYVKRVSANLKTYEVLWGESTNGE